MAQPMSVKAFLLPSPEAAMLSRTSTEPVEQCS